TTFQLFQHTRLPITSAIHLVQLLAIVCYQTIMAQQRRMPAHGPTAPVLGEGTDNSSITAEDVCLRDQRAAGLRFMKAFGVGDVANDELADALSEATKAEVEYGG
ncbi:hypothetical protein VaNZ11_001871, partial [Volvox africanus]